MDNEKELDKNPIETMIEKTIKKRRIDNSDVIENKDYSGSGIYVAYDSDGVTSLNDQTGEVNITSTDSSVTITTTTGEIDLSVEGSIAGVSSLNGEDGDLTIGVNDSTKDINLTADIGVQSVNDHGGEINISSPDNSVTVTINEYADLKLSVTATNIPKSSTDPTNVSFCLDSKHSIDIYNDNDLSKSINSQSLTFNIADNIEPSGLMGSYDENIGTGKGTISISTTPSVPKKFVVGSSTDIVATYNNPYKFVSTDSSVNISSTATDGEIDVKVNNYISTRTVSRTLLEYVSEATEYNGILGFIQNHTQMNFIIKTRTSVVPQTSDTYLDIYYLDYITEKNLKMATFRAYRETDVEGTLTEAFSIFTDFTQNMNTFSIRVVSLSGSLTFYHTNVQNPKYSINLSSIFGDYRIVKAAFLDVSSEGYAQWDFENILTLFPFVFIRYNLLN
jgi:hypothetical protein